MVLQFPDHCDGYESNRAWWSVGLQAGVCLKLRRGVWKFRVGNKIRGVAPLKSRDRTLKSTYYLTVQSFPLRERTIIIEQQELQDAATTSKMPPRLSLQSAKGQLQNCFSRLAASLSTTSRAPACESQTEAP